MTQDAEETHHLHGVHAGHLRVSGRAPDGLVWELGRGWDEAPVEVLLPLAARAAPWHAPCSPDDRSVPRRLVLVTPASLAQDGRLAVAQGRR